MQELTDEEKDMVRRLDWKAMQDYGASFFCLEKLARTKGVSNPEMVARVPRRDARAVPQDPQGPGSALT